MADQYLKTTLAIPVDKIPENDRVCVICTTTYGKRSEDNIIEHALKMRKCGHVIGNYCIRKWFETSNSCPFCRDELFEKERDENGEEIGILDISDDESDTQSYTTFISESAYPSNELDCEPTTDELDELEALGRGPAGHIQEPKGPETLPWRIASNRRRGALADVALYRQIRRLQLQERAIGSRNEPAWPPLQDHETVLNWQADQRLFQYLRDTGAFSQPGMEIERGELSDEAIYENLRNQGSRWMQDRIGWNPGWFLFGRRMVFGGQEIHKRWEERYFEDLQRQGAFCTESLSRYRRIYQQGYEDEGRRLAMTDYEIYTSMNDEDLRWDENRRAWVFPSGPPV
ncbi:hypothetical protein MMC28_010972 [Mycoblastus sanguinarius]|nr:hypothetical protein [Mycoblastus sanguinarius]